MPALPKPRIPIIEEDNEISRLLTDLLSDGASSNDQSARCNKSPLGQNRRGIPPVFLVGCERSGTTLLQSLLAAHSKIHSVPETHFVKRLFRNENRPRPVSVHRNWPKRALRGAHVLRRNILARAGWVSKRGAEAAWREFDEGLGEALFFWEKHSAHAHIHHFVSAMDRACLRTGKHIWLEKTPEHLFYITQIQRYVPGARFIHIVRDGPEVVASLNRLAKIYPQWQPFIDEAFAVERWNHAWRETQRWIGEQNHLIVRYETLLLAPRRTLGKVLKFLDCDPESNLWKLFPDVARSLIRTDEPWKAGNMQSMRDCRKFTKAFDPGKQAWIRDALDQADWSALSSLPWVIADYGQVYE
jgi:hypothetical protein